MSEPLVLEHDPEEGCSFCPLCAADGHGDEYCVGSDEVRVPVLQPAPPECPLRRGGGVLIRTPGGES